MKEREDSKRGGGRQRLFEGAINRGKAIFSRKYSSLILRVGGNFLLLADRNKLL